MHAEITSDGVRDAIIDYVLTDFPSDHTAETIPLEESLYQQGIIDSMGVIELIDFLEKTWEIRIEDDEVTHERMGSITKMTNLVLEKRGADAT